MEVVGSEIGQKMRSAIKAKLTELGCYVDDELPDYVMVMVANKRTRVQMEDDLQLFLGDNTKLFVNWLHQVLKKLQEVTVTTPIAVEKDTVKEVSSLKEKKPKDKLKRLDTKKSKKKDKEKSQRKKEEKKLHKSKKKSKHHDRIRPNVPPLLMNMEKVSEPSITDVFAGQILKNHGITIESLNEDPRIIELKPTPVEIKRPILPIIDPATISSQPDTDMGSTSTTSTTADTTAIQEQTSDLSTAVPEEDQIKEMNDIENKVQGLKQKLTEQLDSMSDDEDFLNIRTEAEDLMNDFAEDVFQEISRPVATPPIRNKSSSPPKQIPPKAVVEPTVETLPQIELNLPKRPVRERLGIREEVKKMTEVKQKQPEKKIESPERFTPEREPVPPTHSKSAKSRLREPEKHKSTSDTSSDKPELISKRLTSRVSVLEGRPSRASCASVVHVRPRPRIAAPSSSLLLRAVADANKSLLNIPPKVTTDTHIVKRALVLPMRRVGDPNIVIQVPAGEPRHTDSLSDNINITLGKRDSDDDMDSLAKSDTDKEDYKSLTMQVKNTEYGLSNRGEVRTASRKDDSLIIETINIHNPTAHKDKTTQFIVTMDGYHPNAFLAKKLMTEGILNDEDELLMNPKSRSSVLKTLMTREKEKKEKEEREKELCERDKAENDKDKDETETEKEEERKERYDSEKEEEENNKQVEQKIQVKETNEIDKVQQPQNTHSEKKRLSNDSEESETRVIIKQEKDESPAEMDTEEVNYVRLDEEEGAVEKRKRDTPEEGLEKAPVVKKRKSSPIIFDVIKKEKKEVPEQRQRTESVSSDGHVVVSTTTTTHKYDSVPSLSQAERKLVWCRSFPMCRYGALCSFQHPRCKFAAACTRRNCPYFHSPASPSAPTVSSHVIPAPNYKSIRPAPAPNMCKYYPSCSKVDCPFFHPKLCHYGSGCLYKTECNFYHPDQSSTKWRYPI